MEKNQKNEKNKKVGEDISNKTDEEIIKDLNKEIELRLPHGKPSDPNLLEFVEVDVIFDVCSVRELVKYVSYKDAIDLKVTAMIVDLNTMKYLYSKNKKIREDEKNGKE